MDQRMKRILSDLDNNALGLDDTFQFKCRACGKCCKNRYDIMLTTRDLYNIAKTLGRTMEYVIDRYCDVYIGDSSRIPIARLLPSGPEQACPLLVNRRCIVHSAKPVVCALFPLGRGIKMSLTEDGAEMPGKFQPTYFSQPITCGAKSHTYTVRDWLEHFGIPIEDEFYTLWTERITALSKTFRGLEARKIPKEPMNLLWNFVFSMLYINYDLSKELISQFRENMTNLQDTLSKIETESFNFLGGVQNGE